MPSRLRGCVLNADGDTPQSGIVVEAFDSATGFTQGEETTGILGAFILSALEDRSWIARRKPGTGSGAIQIQSVLETVLVEDHHGQRSTPSAHSWSQIDSKPALMKQIQSGGASRGIRDALNFEEGLQAVDNGGAGRVDTKLDISGLDEEETPDGAADFVAVYDDAAEVHKKVLLDNMPGGGGGATVNVETVKVGIGHIYYPKAGDRFIIGVAPKALTLTYASFKTQAATNVVFNIEVCDEGSVSDDTGTDIWSPGGEGDQTATATIATQSTFDNAAMTARQEVWVTITSVSGTPHDFKVYLEGTVDS